jgi:hypothetical protein
MEQGLVMERPQLPRLEKVADVTRSIAETVHYMFTAGHVGESPTPEAILANLKHEDAEIIFLPVEHEQESFVDGFNQYIADAREIGKRSVDMARFTGAQAVRSAFSAVNLPLRWLDKYENGHIERAVEDYSKSKLEEIELFEKIEDNIANKDQITKFVNQASDIARQFINNTDGPVENEKLAFKKIMHALPGPHRTRVFVGFTSEERKMLKEYAGI